MKTRFKRGDLVEARIRFGNGEIVRICGYYVMYNAKGKFTLLSFDSPASMGAFKARHYVHDDMVLSFKCIKSADNADNQNAIKKG
jgi:hypothetical protein